MKSLKERLSDAQQNYLFQCYDHQFEESPAYTLACAIDGIFEGALSEEQIIALMLFMTKYDIRDVPEDILKDLPNIPAEEMEEYLKQHLRPDCIPLPPIQIESPGIDPNSIHDPDVPYIGDDPDFDGPEL